MGSAEFLVGLLDQDGDPCVAAEDFDGPHGAALRTWQSMGFVSREPGWNPAAGCPHCGEGAPYRLGERFLCPACRSLVDPRHLLLWRVDRPGFLGWLADQWGLTGGARRIDGRLWQLGTRESEGIAWEFFFRRSGALSDAAAARLAAYRQAVVLHALPWADPADPFRGPRICLLELLRLGETLTAGDPDELLRPRGGVRFDAETGVLWAGDAWLGEVPLWSKEYHFLRCLAEHLDAFVPYADLKREVLRASGSRDGPEEATFCQKLKSRIKARYVPGIDRFVVTTNKADGYRMRAKGKE